MNVQVLLINGQDLRDIKLPVNFAASYAFWYLLAGIILAGLTLWLIRRLNKRFRSRQPAQRRQPELSPEEIANQALAAEYMVKNAAQLDKRVYGVPENIDREIARLKLKAMGISIDTLTPAQRKYLASWQEGT